MDEDKIEAAGLDPVKELLDKLGGWPVLLDSPQQWDANDSFRWPQFNIKSMELGLSTDYIVDHDVDQDDRNIVERAITFDQPDLGMKRDYLIQGFDHKDVQHYYNYMVESAKLLGAKEENALSQMEDALRLEIKL